MKKRDFLIDGEQQNPGRKTKGNSALEDHWFECGD
tara:strand:+ start:1134 stop:1238 length:105 start_codon:yes stop_codon:yes gene_type:complete